MFSRIKTLTLPLIVESHDKPIKITKALNIPIHGRHDPHHVHRMPTESHEKPAFAWIVQVCVLCVTNPVCPYNICVCTILIPAHLCRYSLEHCAPNKHRSIHLSTVKVYDTRGGDALKAPPTQVVGFPLRPIVCALMASFPTISKLTIFIFI